MNKFNDNLFNCVLKLKLRYLQNNCSNFKDKRLPMLE